MQSYYPEYFERDMGTTVAEWLAALPRAVGEHAFSVTGEQAKVQMGSGLLTICWQPLPPRVIALLHMPRLMVVFSFDNVLEAERQAFMKRFDLSTQRGGG